MSTLRDQIIDVLENLPWPCRHWDGPNMDSWQCCTSCQADAILAVVEPALRAAYGDGRDDEAAGLPLRGTGDSEAGPLGPARCCNSTSPTSV